MPSFRLTLEYDGTDFAGWQRQAAGQRTVQGTLEAGLASLVGGPVTLVGAGRTDAGVHAEGQVAGVRLDIRLEPAELLRALNVRLPRDLAVIGVEVVSDGFHARRDARAKHYRYRVWNGPVRSPLRARRSHHVPRPLDLGAMAEASGALLGTHDFASFQAAGSSVETSVRTLDRLEPRGESGAGLCFEVEGQGFLRHMVRNLVGTLLEVGLGRRAPSWPAEVLAARDRQRAAATAPARGLTLMRVRYGRP